MDGESFGVGFMVCFLLLFLGFGLFYAIDGCNKSSPFCDTICKNAYSNNYLSAEKSFDEDCKCLVFIRKSEFGPYLPKTEKE